jgi:CMP-N-acetylneuraminic acid synthetase
MKNLNKIAVIVQARLSSKRIPNKMIRQFDGSTLIDICLEKIKKSKVLNKNNFYFSVYEDELKKIAKKHNVQIWNRSKASANSEGTPLTELFDWWDQLQQYDYAIVISACCPLLKIETIDNFILSYSRSKNDGMMSVVEKKNYFWDHNHNLITPWPQGLEIMNTKFVKPTYETAQCLYGGKLSKIGKGIWMGKFNKPGDISLFPIEESESFDIDYESQFKTIESIYKNIKRVQQNEDI